jgi:hypothetical protein
MIRMVSPPIYRFDIDRRHWIKFTDLVQILEQFPRCNGFALDTILWVAIRNLAPKSQVPYISWSSDHDSLISRGLTSNLPDEQALKSLFVPTNLALTVIKQLTQR